MKIKLDENIGRSGADFLGGFGHDVSTVHDQQLSGCPDESLFEKCIAEARTLVTLDRDFGHIPRFPAQQSAGIVILELGGSGSRQALLDVISSQSLLHDLSTANYGSLSPDA